MKSPSHSLWCCSLRKPDSRRTSSAAQLSLSRFTVALGPVCPVQRPLQLVLRVLLERMIWKTGGTRGSAGVEILCAGAGAGAVEEHTGRAMFTESQLPHEAQM